MFTPYPDIIKITPELSQHLAVIRTRRNFNDFNYIEAKIEAINAYFTKHKLQVAVIGISGSWGTSWTACRRDSPSLRRRVWRRFARYT